MSSTKKVIIDTDPGVDDVLAMLFALGSASSDLEVLLFSVTHGNIDVRSCLRNVVAIFHILDQELRWREAKGQSLGFEGVTKFKPIVAIGADGPCIEATTGESADYFHGADGLGGIHDSHPHFSPPEEEWKHLFEAPPSDSMIAQTAESQDPDLDKPTKVASFTPSLIPAHKEILRLLRENEPDTVTIIAIGPLTNCALAAAEDPETFLRCKELITMGGAVNQVGNVTPVAEFNVFADPEAAARVYALTSPRPSSTMPPSPTIAGDANGLGAYPSKLSRTLNLTLMSLDITEAHVLTRKQFRERTEPLVNEGSPLASWVTAFMTPMLDKMDKLHHGHEGEGASLALHDPMTVWYLLTHEHEGWTGEKEDIRVEVAGQWTRGMTVGDRRTRRRRNSDGEAPHDRGNWLGRQSGNRVRRIVRSPGTEGCAVAMLDAMFGNQSEDHDRSSA